VVDASPDVGSAGWLTVTQESVDADGLGTYRATVDRTGLLDGIYTGTITFDSDRNDVDVRVIMQVGNPAASSADAGYHYVLLVDPISFETISSSEVSAVNGQYLWSLPGVPSGSYYLVAGSDLDNDLFICDPGEACGGYPTTESITPITVSGAVGGLNFITGFNNGISGANTGAPSGGSGYSRRVGGGRGD
jgi:serine protease